MEISGTEKITATLAPPRQTTTNLQPATDNPRLRDTGKTPHAASQTTVATPENASSTTAQGLQENLKTAVEKIQEFVSSTASDIKFSLDEDSGQTVVKVIDRETKEVIRQIPSQEMLDLAQALDKLQGLLIKQKA